VSEMSARAQRIADQIQREIATLIQLEVNDPRVGMVSVTGVDVSNDLAHAKILFTVLNTHPGDEGLVSDTLTDPGALDQLENFCRYEHLGLRLFGNAFEKRVIPSLYLLASASTRPCHLASISPGVAIRCGGAPIRPPGDS
jgi:ribosome-binding factor A